MVKPRFKTRTICSSRSILMNTSGEKRLLEIVEKTLVSFSLGTVKLQGTILPTPPPRLDHAICLRSTPVNIVKQLFMDTHSIRMCVIFHLWIPSAYTCANYPVANCLQNDFCTGLKIGWFFQNIPRVLDLPKLNAVKSKHERKSGCHGQN